MKKPLKINASTVAAMPAFQEMPEVAGHARAGARLGSVAIPTEEHAAIGIWECTPGAFRRQVTKREFSHFLEGRCTFIPDGGEPLEIMAGDAVYFPANCFGTWHVHETLRKTYIIVD